MKNLLFAFFLLSAVSGLLAAADPAADLAAFSVFNNVDINDLAGSDAKTAHGPPMTGRYLSVQSVFVVPAPPSQVVEAMRKWDPSRHRELKVFLHRDVSAAPAPADFAKLESSSEGKVLLEKAQKGAADLQLGKEEAKKLETSGAAAWAEVLAARARSFVSGGSAAEPPVVSGNETIKPNEEINTLLKEQDKVRKQFSGFLGETGIGHGAGSLKPDLYWELVEVDEQPVVTLGASYDRAGGNGTYQAAEVLYYASSGYYVTLTLTQMWPVTVNGKPATLVWRGDLVSSAALADLHGVERLGSESAMMKDIGKQVSDFRKDIGR
jgi:hypothetical protein